MITFSPCRSRSPWTAVPLLVFWVLLLWWGSAAVAIPAAAQPVLTPFQRGVLLSQQGHYPDAIAAFTQAIQSPAQSLAQSPAQSRSLSLAYGNRCLLQLHLNQPALAIADCTLALQYQPLEPEALLNRGVAHYRLGEVTAAIADYTQLLQHHPQDFRAYLNRGLAHRRQHCSQEALADYTQALVLVEGIQGSNAEQQETIAFLYQDRGLVNWQLGRGEQALADLEQAQFLFDQLGDTAVSAQLQRWLQQLYLQQLQSKQKSSQRVILV